MKLAKIQNKEWLDANAFKDIDGDYWLNETAFYVWDRSVRNKPDHSAWIAAGDVGKVVDTDGDYLGMKIEWGLERYLTPENDPEYFL